MAKRRGHGEESIYLRDDGRWAASISLANGKRKTLYGKNRKKVQEKLKKALRSNNKAYYRSELPQNYQTMPWIQWQLHAGCHPASKKAAEREIGTFCSRQTLCAQV